MTRDILEFVERLKAGEVEEQEADLDKETILLSDGTTRNSRERSPALF
jgi:hypothetical protein